MSRTYKISLICTMSLLLRNWREKVRITCKREQELLQLAVT
jgi:hypothetical protein